LWHHGHLLGHRDYEWTDRIWTGHTHSRNSNGDGHQSGIHEFHQFSVHGKRSDDRSQWSERRTRIGQQRDG